MSVFAEDQQDFMNDLYGGETHTEQEAKPSGAEFVEKPGYYHCFVESVKPDRLYQEQFPSVIKLGLRVLSGTENAETEKLLIHRVRLFRIKRDSHGNETGAEPYGHDYAAQAVRAARALALTAQGDEIRLGNINWDQAENRQVIVKVDRDEDEYDDRVTGERKSVVRHQINFGNFWSPLDREDADCPSEVKNCPCDGDYLAALTGGSGIAGGAADLSGI
jgi:hypothetical protein